MIVKNIKLLIKEFIDLGFIGTFYRIGYEFLKLIGFNWFLDYRGKPERIETNISLQSWHKCKGEFFTKNKSEKIQKFLRRLSNKEKDYIVNLANDYLNGKVFCFSNWFADYGYPINWHLNPIKQIEWPKSLHWSKALNFKRGGDVKLVWEVNRFNQVYYFVRAYYLTKDYKYIKGFIGQVRDWAHNNPYPKGVNWASGQELAVRVLAWIFALYNFSDVGIIEEDDFDLLLKVISLHAYHIDKNIHYAYFAVHNNHLIGEALALYAIGTLFPFFTHAIKWKKRGRKILEGKALKQFYPDGGYCQLSHTYHRLALHYYLWAIRIAEVNNEPFSKKVYDIMQNSLHLLYQNMNLSNGKLPNWGNNDGALMNPWTNCNFTDFRPLISALDTVTEKKRVFKSGPWDEEILWFLGHLPKERSIFYQKSSSFKLSGLHIIRKSPQDFIVMRCGTPPDRFGQADQLHVDIFLGGNNIAPDAGSYLYNDELRYHGFFMGTRSHNTVYIDDEDQMLLWRRFKWLYNTKANLLNWNPTRGHMEGEHYGYQRIDKGVVHKRKVIWENNPLIIIDTLTNALNRSHQFTLHWQLNVNRLEYEEKNHVFDGYCETEGSSYYIYIIAFFKKEIIPLDLNIQRGFDDGNNVEGWISRYYGNKNAVYAMNVVVNINHPFKFITVFSKNAILIEELLECTSY